MNAYTLLLFAHLSAVSAGFAGSALIHLGLARLGRANSVDQARDAVVLLGRIGPLMPFIALGLLTTGSALASLQWGWRPPFAVVGFVGLAVMQILGGAVVKPRLAALGRALFAATPGAIDPELRRAMRDQVVFRAAQVQLLLAIGIMLCMVTKPGYGGGFSILGVAVVAGLATGAPPRTHQSASLWTHAVQE